MKLITACSNLHQVLFLALSVTLVFVYEVSREPLNRCAPNSQRKRVWSLAQTSLNVKVKGQGHHGQKNGVFVRYLGTNERICTNSHGRRVRSFPQTSLKVKVNFGGLHAVYVWKNVFALVETNFISIGS